MILGSYLISMAIRPTKNVKLTKWNIMDAPPTPTEHGGMEYFVMVTHGLQAGPMEIILDFEVRTRLLYHEFMNNISDYQLCKLPFCMCSSCSQTETNHNGPVVDISVVTTHWTFDATPIFSDLLARFPKWAFPVSNVASVQAFVF